MPWARAVGSEIEKHLPLAPYNRSVKSVSRNEFPYNVFIFNNVVWDVEAV
jgi:hypothetical protein